ncbi:MAG: hypothetical protein ACFNQH_01375, partial [Veillonella parvula]
MKDTYGDWTVLYQAENRGHSKYWHCRCSCGVERDVAQHSLTSGKSLSCGHERRKVDVSKIIGDRYNYLVVMYIDRDQFGRAVCHCKCDCGNEVDVLYGNLQSGHTKSCGCAKLNRFNKYVGNRYGRLTIVKRVENVNNKITFLCKCDCGNEVIAKLHNLTRGHIISCGCARYGNGLIDLRNEDFDGITPIKHVGGKRSMWLFRCRCGNEFVADPYKIKTGHTTSCGCKNISKDGSKTENEIKDFIMDYCSDIELHNREYLDGKEIDIYLPVLNIGIEYNGSYYHSSIG